MSFAGLVTGLVNRTQIYRALQGSYRLCALYSLYFVPEPPYSTYEGGQCAHPIKILRIGRWPTRFYGTTYALSGRHGRVGLTSLRMQI